MKKIPAACGQTVRIAYQGENNRTQVAFDLSDIMEEFPGGTAVLTIRRPGDADAVPSLSVEMDGTDLVWTVTAWECEKRGFLYAQIVYSAGETVAKTKIYRFDILDSMLVSGEGQPDTWQDWVNELVGAAAGVNDAIDAAESTLDEKVAAADDAREAAETAQAAAETAQGGAESAEGHAQTAKGQAESARDAAQGYAAAANADADRAEQAANNLGYLEMEIVDGHLIFRKTELIDCDFELVNGHLILEVA